MESGTIEVKITGEAKALRRAAKAADELQAALQEAIRDAEAVELHNFKLGPEATVRRAEPRRPSPMQRAEGPPPPPPPPTPGLGHPETLREDPLTRAMDWIADKLSRR